MDPCTQCGALIGRGESYSWVQTLAGVVRYCSEQCMRDATSSGTALVPDMP